MVYQIRNRDEHWISNGAPRRVLALDGGGIRGIFTLGVLKSVEDLLRARHGGSEEFRLAHYFDLIAGTSTGAIIAAALALGMSVDEVRAHYLQLGREVFERSLFRRGLVRAKYDADRLSHHLKRVLGPTVKLGGLELSTGLMVVVKRLDTSSPWPLTNNPRDPYFVGSETTGRIGIGDYPLWSVVRASTAAPHYFDPEPLTIARRSGSKPVSGSFVDGGVSPHNNPALQALLYVLLAGCRVRWRPGADRLLLTSVGTGRRQPEVAASSIAGKHALQSVVSIMDDCADLIEMMLQWMSASRTARSIDRAIGSLDADLLGGQELLSYFRYNVVLSRTEVESLLGRKVAEDEVAKLSAMDAPSNMRLLDELGRAAGVAQVREDDFGSVFDLDA